MEQKKPSNRIPRWLSYAMVLVLVGHFTILAVFQFSRVYLPEKFYYLTNHYVSPWFYQNFKVFAPEPPTFRRVFVYRVKLNGSWTQWNAPAFPWLQRHWNNRLSYASEMHDMLEALADNIVFTAERADISTYDADGQWHRLPAYQSAKDFVIKTHENADSLQMAVLIEHHIMVEDTLSDSYSLYPFQKDVAKN